MSSVPRATRREPPTPTEELHILRKLGLRPDFFCGAITPADRGARLRKALDDKSVGRVAVFRGRDETWAEACDRWYGPAPVSTDQPTTGRVHG